MIDAEKEMQQTIGGTTQFMSKMIEAANVSAVFGKPVEHGDSVIIPCCEVAVGGGMGFGSGPGETSEQRKGSTSTSIGGGGGGGANARPIAVIVMTPEGVRVKPIMDLTKVLLAEFTLAAFMLPWLVRLFRAAGGGKGKELSFGQLKRAIKR